MLIFGRVLPVIRERVGGNLRRRGLSRERVLAAVVRLMEITLFRIGNSEYARTNKSYGLTTLRDRHVEFDGSRIHLSFRGKHGIRHETDISDRRLARIIKDCRDLPGYELFQYVDDGGNRHTIDSREHAPRDPDHPSVSISTPYSTACRSAFQRASRAAPTQPCRYSRSPHPNARMSQSISLDCRRTCQTYITAANRGPNFGAQRSANCSW
jgi:DNA topoisomerase IB